MDKSISISDPFVSLPDSVLKHIIDLLPFDDAARTQAISPTWSRVWPCSAMIVLDERPFTDDGVHGRAAFISHARRFTSRYNRPKVHSFILRFSHPSEYISDVRDWLSLATRASAEEVELNFSDPDGSVVTNAFPMPSEIGQLSHYLRLLRTSGCGVTWDVTTSFVSLRTLYIEGAEIQPDPSLDVLLRSCPSLEELSLVKLRLDDIKIVNRSRRLLRLTIEDCEQMSLVVFVKAPVLKYFKYSGNLRHFTLTVPRVEEVVLDFGSESRFYEFGDLLRNLLQSLSSARSLNVCSYITQVIPTGRDPLYLPAPAYIRHLKHILLRTELHRDELPGIALLLRSYEKLQTITFVMGTRKFLQRYQYPAPIADATGDLYFWRDQIHPIPCLGRCLKVVTIEGFQAKINEMTMLDLFLKHAKCLKEMIITVSKETPANIGTYIAAAQRLEQCKKLSRHVKIVVS